jgi:hypothetical protein
MPSARRRNVVIACLVLSISLVSCRSGKWGSKKTVAATPAAARIQGVNLNDPIRPAADDNPIVFGAAKNEWASFALQISSLPHATHKPAVYSFRMHAPHSESGGETIAIENISVEQILPMPVDVNRAGFVRHTGLAAAQRPLPRALLPMTHDRGVVNLSTARDPADPTSPTSRAAGSREPLLFWVDLHVPPETAPGEYVAQCDLLASDSPQPIASVPIKITIYDFLMRDERDLIMTSRLEWEDLRRLYPAEFETVTPRLINRSDSKYAHSVKVLDSLVRLAQLHRTEVIVPRLQPTAKWPAGRPPQVDWDDLDTLIAPWLSGEMFPDKIPLNYWPLPPVDYLDRFDRKSQLQYWSQAAAHFDQKNWLARCPAVLDLPVPGRASTAQALQISADAAQILSAHPQLRVSLPLEEDQIQLAGKETDNFIDPAATARLMAASPGIIFAAPLQQWPAKVAQPAHWLRTDVPGLVPYVGAGGDERDVRVWSWLATLRKANLIQWGSPLPRTSSPTEAADPNDLVWFYPGSWFGVDEPLATVQLKWLRRAQQDYQYLWLARQRGEVINAALMARLITKPVKIQPGQSPDPLYALLTGTSDPSAWSEAQRLLARVILSREPGQAATTQKSDELGQQLLHWSVPQEQALLIARNAEWGSAVGGNPGDNWLSLRVGIDIYNASDGQSDPNQLEWTVPPKGWEVVRQPVQIRPLQPYHVDRFAIESRFNLNAIDVEDRTPAEVTFTNGFNKRSSRLQFALPVSASDRHGPGLKIDGKLDDWDIADAIQNTPLIRMLNRPALQKQEIQYAQHPSTIYTAWADENFYLAFKLAGVQTGALTATRNFVDYQFRRAWAEDLAEVLIQPIFADNTVGPILHIVCKPAGHWVERKRDPRVYSDPWQPFEGSGLRYTATMNSGEWNGEVAIPWKMITDKDRGLPKLLRFNFVQHTHATGESASWAGPIDFGRDDSFMGVLYVRETTDPGMASP